jgi:hypothetical protein
VSRPPTARTCIAAVLVLASCQTGGSRVSPGQRDAGADGTPSPPRCLPPPGVSGAPTSIAEVVTLVNSLPRPVTLSCFLESLDRPLRASAATSVFSLQPSVGRRSPRIFLFFGPVLGPLVISIVPGGRGSHTLECGQMVTDLHSVKAEVAFPIVDDVTPASPYDRVRDSASETPHTICRGCHDDESRHDAIDYADAFASIALRPLPRAQVTVDELLAERRSCDAALEPERCAFLASLFDHGDVLPQDFPANLRTFTTQ